LELPLWRKIAGPAWLRLMSTAGRPHADLGRAIREIRKEKKLTQEQLAHASGLHFTEISHLEAGRRNLKLDTLKAVARGLGVPRWYLMATEERIELKRRATYLRGG
jgi:transcriptional regulator with XRE-family HTH domain